MRKISLWILTSLAIYCVLTLPHFVYMQTGGTTGIRYSMLSIILTSVFSVVLTPAVYRRLFGRD